MAKKNKSLVKDKHNNIDLNSACVTYDNVAQGLIRITEDKLKVILLDYKDKNHHFYSWTTPLGIFLSCLLATITADFKDTIGIASNVWQSVFLLCTIGTSIWLCYSIILSFKNRKGRKIDQLIDKIKAKDEE